MDHDVGGGEEVVERRPVVGLVEVEHDAALAAHPRLEARPGADGVPAGRFDGDDVGARLGQQQGRHRPGDPVGQVDDADAVEDPGVVRDCRVPPSFPPRGQAANLTVADRSPQRRPTTSFGVSAPCRGMSE